jgi:ABC-type multidrug transport system fused ATPase/permease subunit
LLRFLLLLFLLFFFSFFLSFFRQKFIRHISRRLQNGNQWNFTGMLSTMSRCADYFRNFQNGHRCHGNQGAKNVKFKPYSGSFWNLTQK